MAAMPPVPDLSTHPSNRSVRRSLMRSEPMVMLQMIVPADAASETVEELGEIGTVQFCDLNEGATAFQRNFVAQMKDCDEVERCLRYLGEQVAHARLPEQREGEGGAEELLAGLGSGPPHVERLNSSFADMRTHLLEIVSDLKQLNSSEAQLSTNYNHLVELSHVLQKCDDIFSEARQTDSTVVPRTLSSADLAAAGEVGAAASGAVGAGAGGHLSATAPLPPAARGGGYPSASCGGDGGGSSSIGGGRLPTIPGGGIDLEGGLRSQHEALSRGLTLSGEAQTRLGYIAGVVSRSRLSAFERILFRATRGNMYLRSADIAQQVRDPHSGELIFKSVFIIFFSGQHAMHRVAQICDNFSANRYHYPAHYETRGALLSEVQTRIDDLRTVIHHATRHKASRLASLHRSLPSWRNTALKQKAVYRVLNMWNYDLTRKCLIAEAWCPLSSFAETQAAIRRGAHRSGATAQPIVNVIDTDESAPTFFRQTKFTSAFQAIVDGYGTPRCGEINPTPFLIVTYPFLFGVMFGDVGHGLIVLCASLYFIRNERKYSAMRPHEMGEILSFPWHGRYVLLLMSLFSIYCGLIYNDTFGLMADLFGTAYDAPTPGESRARSGPGAVYPFGIDPAWHGTANELAFSNSYKMKLSIIIGVLQMSLGIGLSLANALHFRNAIDVWCEFVPQAIFFGSIFGYLVFCIVYKWMHDWVELAERPPSLISMLIAFFMSPGRIPADAVIYDGQAGVQQILGTCAFISVPWMLLAKPLLLRRRHQRLSGYKTVGADPDGSSRRLMDDDSASPSPSDASVLSDKNGKAYGAEFDFAEILIHQVIHTIEFVLGSISNTASYLRLWALSLAHKQLSQVFYEMILRDGGFARCGGGGSWFSCGIGMVPAFFIWTLATVGILCVMELLSAFLHALRLHWVEFQNKFYKGDGRKFDPFSFSEIRRQQHDAD
jgi:V-type H+-transporting ATPase subunit a